MFDGLSNLQVMLVYFKVSMFAVVDIDLFLVCSQAYNLGLEEIESGIFDPLQNIVEMYDMRLDESW